jgi:hypothetical protein
MKAVGIYEFQYLVLVDTEMPVMDGHSFRREMKFGYDRAYSNIPIILMDTTLAQWRSGRSSVICVFDPCFDVDVIKKTREAFQSLPEMISRILTIQTA